MTALSQKFRNNTAIAASVGTAIVGSAVLGTALSELTRNVPDVSKIADVCTSDRLCDGYQMKIAMRQGADLSLESPVGKALATIGAQSNVPAVTILNLMGQFDQNLHTTKNYATVVEVDGMAIIRPPQYKLNPALPFNERTNPYGKANYDAVVLTTLNGKCASYSIRPDGTFQKIEDLTRRTSSHGGITSEECAEKRERFMAKMNGPQV